MTEKVTIQFALSGDDTFHLSISHVREQVTDRVDKINIDSLLKHRLVLVNLVKRVYTINGLLTTTVPNLLQVHSNPDRLRILQNKRQR